MIRILGCNTSPIRFTIYGHDDEARPIRFASLKKSITWGVLQVYFCLDDNLGSLICVNQRGNFEFYYMKSLQTAIP